MNLQLSIWDAAGEERYRQGGLIPIIYRGADAAVLMYDITCPKSFESIVEWLNELELHCRRESILVILVANKLDREQHRKVETKSAEILAASRQMMFREASSVDESRMEQVEGELSGEVTGQKVTSAGLVVVDFEFGQSSPAIKYVNIKGFLASLTA